MSIGLNQLKTSAADKTTGKNFLIALKQFNKLPKKQKELAVEGFDRYVRACRNLDVEIDYTPFKEIIDDAKQGRQVWKESDKFFLESLENE